MFSVVIPKVQPLLDLVKKFFPDVTHIERRNDYYVQCKQSNALCDVLENYEQEKKAREFLERRVEQLEQENQGLKKDKAELQATIEVGKTFLRLQDQSIESIARDGAKIMMRRQEKIVEAEVELLKNQKRLLRRVRELSINRP
jgi:L-2-hydroxyglutarate oxidase LhgO